MYVWKDPADRHEVTTAKKMGFGSDPKKWPWTIRIKYKGQEVYLRHNKRLPDGGLQYNSSAHLIFLDVLTR